MSEPITPQGYDLLTQEFRFLTTVHKPQVAHEKQIAAALGDRSENAEYQAAKEKLRRIDKRLFYLNSIIQKSTIVDPSCFTHTKVSFGSSVKLLELTTKEIESYTLCGSFEAEAENGLISIHAPLARLLLGKEEGDVVVLKLPHAKKEYEILELFYQDIFSLKKNIRKEADFLFY